MVMQVEKYSAHFPDARPSRVREALAALKKLQLGNEHRYQRLHYLRQDKEYRNDRKSVRRTLGIPQEGYGIRAAKRSLGPLERGYLEYHRRVRGRNKFIMEAAKWTFLTGQIAEFALRHPLRKSVPMPFHMAFTEIVYKNYKARFELIGYYRYDSGGRLHAFYDNSGGNILAFCKTRPRKVPQPIERLISYRLRDGVNKHTKIVRIIKSDSASGYWEITQIP